jgi:hypothetical protein
MEVRPGVTIGQVCISLILAAGGMFMGLWVYGVYGVYVAAGLAAVRYEVYGVYVPRNDIPGCLWFN